MASYNGIVESGAQLARDLADDVSSGLSEPEDDERDDEMMNADAHGTLHARRDGYIDSEAETERLDQTPNKARKTQNGDGRTPSKLAAVDPADNDLSDPPSPLPAGPGAASSTSTTAASGKKRKRSDAVESPLTSEESDMGDLPRKRSHEVAEDEAVNADGQEETAEAADEISAPKAAPVKGRGRTGKTKRGGRKAKEASEVPEAIENDDSSPEEEANEDTVVKSEENPAQKSEAVDMFAALTKQFTAFRDALHNERLTSIDGELALLEQSHCTHPEYLRLMTCVEQRRAKQEREAKAYFQYRIQSIGQRTLGERSQLHSQYFQTIRELREDALEKLGEDWCSIQRERRQGVAIRDDQDDRFVYRFIPRRGELLRQQAKYNYEVSILSGLAKYVGFPAAPELKGVEDEGLKDDLKSMKLYHRVQPPMTNTHLVALPEHSPHNQHTHSRGPYVPRPTTMRRASAERIAHEQYIEQHAWARAPQSASALHHPTVVGTPNISHTPDWAEPAGGFRKSGSALAMNHRGLSPAPDKGRSSPLATPLPSGARRESKIGSHNASDGAAHGGGKEGDASSSSSPLQVRNHMYSARAPDNDGWRNVSGTSTIDAPLAEPSNERDMPGAEPMGPAKRENPRGDGDSKRADMPLFAMGQNASGHLYDPNHLRGHLAATPGQAGERTEMYRTPGFRPLEGAFGTPTPGPTTVGGRVTGGGVK